MTYILETMLDNAKSHEQRRLILRVNNRLCDKDIETVEEIQGLTKYQLKKLYGIGDESVNLLEELLGIEFADGEARSVELERKRTERNRQIEKDYEDGLTKAEIARKHGISNTQVTIILRAKEKTCYSGIDGNRLVGICRKYGYFSAVRNVENLMFRKNLIDQNGVMRDGLTYQDVIGCDGIGKKTAKVICEYLGVPTDDQQRQQHNW